MSDINQDLEEKLDRLKAGLVATVRSETTDFTPEEYNLTRRLLRSNHSLRLLLPSWLNDSSTLPEANRVIRSEADQQDWPGGKWAKRERLIAEGLNSLISELRAQGLEFAKSGELGELIGSGGFGQVYRWHHSLLDMDFAVKILSPSFSTEEGRYLERFFLEARILLKLNHPNIVRIYDVGMTNRRPFIRMELLEGQNFNQVLQQRGLLNCEEAAKIVLALAEGLEHAHKLGVVHRDLKPSNTFLTNEGTVRLIDFGLGAFVEGDLVSRITRTGEAPAGGLFTAPELVANPKLLDLRTDLYSLGAIWFNLLTGRPPAGASIETNLDTVDGMSPEYKTVLLRLLADESSRFQSATEVIAAINSLFQR